MFNKRVYRNFINKKHLDTFKSLDEVVFVKCNNISNSLDKYIKTLLGSQGVIVKELWYTEEGVGSLGIPIALKRYREKVDKPFYALSIRGKTSKPHLYYVTREEIRAK